MIKRVVFLLLVVLMVVTLVACGTPTPPPVDEEPPPEEEVTPPPEEEVTPPVVDWEPPAVPWEPPVEEEPTAPGVLPPIKFEAISADLGGIRLIGDDLAPYGIDLPSPVEAPWTITIPKGSTITITIGVSGHPQSGEHHIIIEGTDVDVELGVGEERPPMELTFNEAGTFKVYSENLPAELECLIVVTEPTPVVEEPAPKMAKYKCTVCPYVYDPELGDPDGGIKPGTPFEEIPDDWVCPVCRVDKSKFEVVEE